MSTWKFGEEIMSTWEFGEEIMSTWEFGIQHHKCFTFSMTDVSLTVLRRPVYKYKKG